MFPRPIGAAASVEANADAPFLGAPPWPTPAMDGESAGCGVAPTSSNDGILETGVVDGASDPAEAAGAASAGEPDENTTSIDCPPLGESAACAA